MKKQLLSIIILLIAIAAGMNTANAQPKIYFQPITQTNINLDGPTTVLGQVSVTAPVSGKVVVHFDGDCTADKGDRIVLAASDHADWDINDGSIGIEVIDPPFNYKSFSHTRVYDITAGTHTYYAVGQNYVEKDGSGIASVYGTLTVEYFPSTSSAFAAWKGINFSGNLRGATVTVGQLNVTIPSEGKVIVRFDGESVQDVGDRIVLAASDTADWGVNDGCVSVEVPNSDQNAAIFSHTRVYDVTAGNYTYYAVAENFVETAGSGSAYILGSLTVEFFPKNGTQDGVAFKGIATPSTNLRPKSVAVDSISMLFTSSGKLLLHFDGHCISSPGDRIVLAASNTHQWGINDGAVMVNAADNDVNANSFSHTRVYDITAGTHTYYADVQNYVQTSGAGYATIYGSLTGTFFADGTITGVQNIKTENSFSVFPNPANGKVYLMLNNPDLLHTAVQLTDITGRIIRTIHPSADFTVISTEGMKGVYLLQAGYEVKKIIVQ